MVEQAEQATALKVGRPALGARDQVMNLAVAGKYIAAGESAVLVARDDSPAQRRRDTVG